MKTKKIRLVAVLMGALLVPLLTGCTTVRDIGHAIAAVPFVYYDAGRDLVNHEWEYKEVELIRKRNNCLPPKDGVFGGECKLSEPDERKMEKWRRMAIPQDCKSQWPTDPPDPCWAREHAREAAWDKMHKPFRYWEFYK